jgi:hypothetical protein
MGNSQNNDRREATGWLIVAILGCVLRVKSARKKSVRALLAAFDPLRGRVKTSILIAQDHFECCGTGNDVMQVNESRVSDRRGFIRYSIR